jgi:hypothetical protein
MIIGTEGKPDYLVCARKGGYVLGIKPLLQCGEDQCVYGFRLRLQKGQTGADITNKHADLEGMTKVFAGIPWKKRSSQRFSTMVLTELAWGVEFQEQILSEISTGLDDLLTEVSDKFADDETWIDFDDMRQFLGDAYSEQSEAYLNAYHEYLAQAQGTTTTSSDTLPEGQVVAFPIGDSDVED